MIEPTPHVDPQLLADMREAARLDELSEARQQAIVSSVMKGVAGRRYSSSRTGEWLRRAATVVAALGMTKVTVALALGGGAALVAHQYFAHRPVAVVQSSLTTPAPATLPVGELGHREVAVPAQVESEPVAPVVADAPRSHAAPHAAAKSEPVATTAEPDGLRRETELLDGARSALLHGQPSAALGLVSQYRQEFPKGRLGSAAGLVEAQALLAAGQPQRAADRARELLRTNRSGPFADKLRAIIAQVEH